MTPTRTFSMNPQRRLLLKGAGAASALLAAGAPAFAASETDTWARADQIRASFA